jgi:outer membrane protein
VKLFKKSVAAAAILTAGLVSPSALAEKVGYVNIQAIFQSLPQTAAVEPALRDEFKDQIQEVTRLEKDIKYYMEKQQCDAATMSEAEKQDLQKKIQELGKDYQTKAGELKQALDQRQGEERNKILALIKQSIDSFAEKEKYDVILNAGSVVYLKNMDQEISNKIVEIVSKIK